MPFPYENERLTPNIVTYEVYQVNKMPDMFLEVEFTYPRSAPWRTAIPILEKYQGINFTESSRRC